jgi:thiamine biosynthesis protein ThiI
VPFFQINKQFLSFDQSRNYLLYCEKGVMSQLHALHIKDQGFENVGVYRPKS